MEKKIVAKLFVKFLSIYLGYVSSFYFGRFIALYVAAL